MFSQATSINGSEEELEIDAITLGHRLRHHRAEHDLTLTQVADKLGTSGAMLSLIENGKREPTLNLLSKLAQLYKTTVDGLLEQGAPSSRVALEIAVEKAQRSPAYAALGLPQIKISSRTPSEVLEVISGLQDELARRHRQHSATPEVARQANVDLRREQREHGNYYPILEQQALELLAAVNHTQGPLTHHKIADLADYLGFKVRFVSSLPHSTRSVTDMKNRVFYLSGSRSPDHESRAVLLQAIAAYALGHGEPVDYEDFLRQRIYTNYVAAAMLIPERQAVRQLKRAHDERDIAIEDIRDAFGVSYESAAHRFTNLATEHLAMPCHFQKVHESGIIHKAYENDDVNFPTDSIGAIEGQAACRYWTCREVFGVADRFRAFNQYTDTAAGTFWCTAVVESSFTGNYSLSIGVPFDQARWFRGKETTERSVSTCPDPSCCRQPAAHLQQAWDGHAWPAARANAHILAALPSGPFPGVDEVEVYEFLERQQRLENQ